MRANSFGQIFGPSCRPTPHHFQNLRWRGPHRLARDPTAHLFDADVPGVKKEVKVEIEDRKVLQISGERLREVGEVCDTWRHVERSRGSFMRRVRLPEDGMVDHVKAAMENGVVTVTVPKDDAKKKKPDVESVEIHG